ncbi:low density lipoprotein receptor adapter protein 1-A-like isoform 2-T2 [Menidia menidia]
MDALRSAGRALVRSPSAAGQAWTAGRHRKLPENWTDTRETILEGMTFNLRHLGMTLVDQPRGEELSAAAVKRIVATAKAGRKKPPKVSLKVSPGGIALLERSTSRLLENVSIYRISYCTVDRLHHRVFAYIAQNTLNGTLECHAYLCSKRKVAQAVALTVAQAFTVAFELWQAGGEEEGQRGQCGSAGDAGSSSHSERSNSFGSLKEIDAVTESLLDLEERGSGGQHQLDDHWLPQTNNSPAREMEDSLDEAFSSCALDSIGWFPDWQCHVLTPRSWTLG